MSLSDYLSLPFTLLLAAAAATEESTSSPLDSPPSTPPPEKEQHEHVNGNGTTVVKQQPQQESVGIVSARTTSDSSNSENSSAGGNVHDALMQLRVWKERSARMEVLLTKKSAKIQEMEETVRLCSVLCLCLRCCVLTRAFTDNDDGGAVGSEIEAAAGNGEAQH